MPCFPLQLDTREGVVAALERKQGKSARALDRNSDVIVQKDRSLVSQVSNLKTGFERQNAPGNRQKFGSLLPELFHTFLVVSTRWRLETKTSSF